jgi:DNA-binding response OmpR family regulator
MSAHLLLIEDDPTTRLALKRMLEMAGYAVSEAANGQVAKQLLDSEVIDLVVSDMRLPDIDGIQLIQAAQQSPNTPAVILLTGYRSIDSAVAALDAGAYEYLLKPCAPQTLLATIAAALDPTKQQRHSTRPSQNLMIAQTTLHADLLALGRLQIGTNLNDATLAGTPLKLTPIEHALLRCLAEALGSPVSYQTLIRHTHGYEASAAEAQILLRAHINRIHYKTQEPIIQSVQDYGFRLNLDRLKPSG